jgi:hypothetical protein
MKKNIFFAAILMLAGAMMTACSDNDDFQSESQTLGNTVVLSGTLGSKGDQTRTVAEDGVGSWEIGDQFAIYYQTASGHASAIASVVSINDNGSANFTATLGAPKKGSNNVSLVYPATAHDGKGGFKTDALMNQGGTLEYINENGLDIETAATTMNVSGTTATLTSDVQMQPEVCIYRFQLRKDNYNDAITNNLEINDGTHTYTITAAETTSIFTVALLPTENADFTFSTITTEGGPNYIYTKRIGVTLANCTAENVGDVFDSDGNVYAVSRGTGLTRIGSFSGVTLEKGKFYSQKLKVLKIKRPVAVIVYVGEHGTVDDSSTDPQTGFHGLAMSMQVSSKNNTTNANQNWDVAGDSKFFSSGKYRWCNQSSEACTSHACDDIAVARELKNGISMTDELVSHESHTHWAARTARNYNAAQYKYERNSGPYSNSTEYYNLPLPSGTSNWFLPSIGQWQLIVWGLLSKKNGENYFTPLTEVLNADMNYDALNSILTKAGADGLKYSCENYYSSTESANNSTWTFTLSNGSGSHVINSTKTGAWDPYTRAVVAF